MLSENSFYNKTIEQISPLNIDVFQQIDEQNVSTASLIIFLLEHRPLEIDLNRLKSTNDNESKSNERLFLLNLFPSNFVQHTKQSNDFMKKIFEKFQKKNLEELLLCDEENQTIYRRCFDLLVPFLTKTTLNSFPVAFHNFYHLVKSLNGEPLVERFDWIFSVCLTALDEPNFDMKMSTLDLFDHFQRHCTTTELSLFNRSAVIMWEKQFDFNFQNFSLR